MKKTLFLILLLLSAGIMTAQEKLSKEEKERREKNVQAGNPFAKFGSKAPVATLSKGKYLEVHDLDSIVTIGTIRWHVENQKIVGKLIRDRNDPDAQPIGDATGRWMSPDPLSEEFSGYSPYNFVFNNPVRFVDPDGRAPDDIVFFNTQGQEIHRIESNTIFKTFVSSSSGTLYPGASPFGTFAEAKMPGKITYSLDKNVDPSSDKYNKYDYDIAAATYIINQGIKEQSLSVGNGYTIGKGATELDVSLVKSLAYKESRLGQGVSISTNASDIFSMFNMGDYGDKGKMGMTVDDVKNGKGASSSTQWGTKWLYYKAFKSSDGKTKDFQGWDYAIQKYGPGAKEKDYKETVFKIYNSITNEN